MDLRGSVAAELRKLPEELRTGALAAAALTLAELVPESSPRDAAALTRELRLTLAELRGLAVGKTQDKEVDPVDELAARRAARITSQVPDGSAAGA